MSPNFTAWWAHNGEPEAWRTKDLAERCWNAGYAQCYEDRVKGRVVESVDTSGLNPDAERHAGSIPASLTNQAALIKAAEKYADYYDGDERAHIGADVMNAFFAGWKYAIDLLRRDQTESGVQFKE